MKTEEIIPYETMLELYLDKKLTDDQIGKIYDLTLGQVHRLRNKYRIKAIAAHERHPKSTIDPQEMSLFVGLLLGDGHCCLKAGKDTNPFIMIEQSVIHRDYIFWLFEIMKDWLPAGADFPRQVQHKDKRTGKIYHSYAFNTVHHPAFFKLYHAFYKDGKKCLNDLSLIKEYLNAFALAIWIMDDGTLTGKCKRNVLCTNNFTKDEVNILRNMLQECFGFKTWICKRTTVDEVNYEIAFDRSSSIAMSKLIKDLILPSFQYKLIPSETTNDTDS